MYFICNLLAVIVESCENKHSGPNLRYFPGIYPWGGGLKKSKKKTSVRYLYLSRDSNRSPPDFKSEALPVEDTRI
jgi:hypothetical protein